MLDKLPSDILFYIAKIAGPCDAVRLRRVSKVVRMNLFRASGYYKNLHRIYGGNIVMESYMN